MASGAHLVVDTHTLKRAGNTLKTIHESFTHAGDHSKDAASQLGPASISSQVSSLVKAIQDFASNWDDRRKKLAEGVDALSQAVTEIASAFENTDSELAKTLSGTNDEMCRENDPTSSQTDGTGSTPDTESRVDSNAESRTQPDGSPSSPSDEYISRYENNDYEGSEVPDGSPSPTPDSGNLGPSPYPSEPQPYPPESPYPPGSGLHPDLRPHPGDGSHSEHESRPGHGHHRDSHHEHPGRGHREHHPEHGSHPGHGPHPGHDPELDPIQSPQPQPPEQEFEPVPVEPELDNDTPPIEPDPSEAGPVEPDVPESEPTNLEPTENEPQPSTPEPETEPELGSISESERSGGGGSAPLEQSLAEDSPLAEPLDGDQLPNDDASTQANSSQASSEYLTNIPSESSTVISDINHSTSASGIGSSMMGGTSVGASSVGGHSPERTTDRSRASHSEADSKEDSDEKSETRARGQEGKPRVRERRVDTDSEVGLFRAGPGEN